MDKQKIIISPTSIIIFLAFIVLLLFVSQITNALLLLFASFIITSALHPPVEWMSRKMPRGLVVTLVFLIGLVVIITLLIPFVSVIISQFQELIKKSPDYWDHIITTLEDFELLALDFGFMPELTDTVTYLTKIGEDVLRKTINITINVFTGIVGAFTLAVIVLFMLLDEKKLVKGYLSLYPVSIRERAGEISANIAKKVGGYVRGQLFLMFSVGLMTFIGLKIVGLEFALLLGIVAGVLEIIPVAGPILASVPGIFIALAIDPMLALWVLLVYIIVQRIENHLLTPMILGKFLAMHPLIIIAAILFAASTLGVVGVILSPAIAAVVYVLIQELYLKKIEQDAIPQVENPENNKEK